MFQLHVNIYFHSGPKFQIIAKATLRLDEVKATVSTYDLLINSASDTGEIMLCSYLQYYLGGFHPILQVLLILEIIICITFWHKTGEILCKGERT